MLIARALVVIPAAALLAFGAVRAMTFVAPPGDALRVLEPTFASHPQALLDSAMGEIGSAAARGGTVPASARHKMAQVARKAPLAADPFLVGGTIAELDREPLLAERLFLAARARSPRSPGGRYFLADRFLKTGRIVPGLIEMGALARLSEKAAQPLVPALAAYARSPGAVPALRRFFERSPAVRDGTLSLLAEDPGNLPLILALASDHIDRAKPADWQGRLVTSLVAAGDYSGAEALWRKLAGVEKRGLLFNSQFQVSAAPPPFNWQMASGTSGVAEASGSGGLDVIYYGRTDVTLASQLLRLVPGRYQLAMRLEGPSRETGLSWNIMCLPGNAALLQLPLGKGAISGDFTVPAMSCQAQAIELRGRPVEASETTQLTIRDLKLETLAAAQ